MDALIRARPAILGVFFSALATLIVAGYLGARALLGAAAGIAQIALFLFLLTESFGSLSLVRGKCSRILARTMLCLSGFVVAGLVTNMLLQMIA